MPAEINLGGFTFGTGAASAGAPVSPDAPFRICVIGDFGGARGGEGGPIEVDRDNFEEVLERLNVIFECEIRAGEPAARVQFRALDDFHPDHLYESIATFESLRKLRRQLLNPQTFAAAAAEVRSWLPEAATGSVPEPQPPVPAAESIDAANLLDGILETADAEAGARGGAIDWNSVIRDIVRPYSIPAVDPQQDVLVECVDAVIGRTMTAVLHHPRFRELEAAWRGLWLLVRRLETDSRLKVFLLDVPRAALASDADSAWQRMQREVVEKTVGTPGGQPWAVVLGLYDFGPDEADAQRLNRFAKLAQAGGAPFVAAAEGSIPGCSTSELQPDAEDWQPAEIPEAWQELRASAGANSVCLLWPSFVLRLPYGPKTSPTESFKYAELSGPPQKSDYLWGNPALIAGILLGQSYTESGWGLRIGEQSEVGGLPLHIYDDDGEKIARPCTEIQLTETGSRRVVDCGLTPVWSVRDQDVVQLPDLKSLSGGALKGRWQ